MLLGSGFIANSVLSSRKTIQFCIIVSVFCSCIPPIHCTVFMQKLYYVWPRELSQSRFECQFRGGWFHVGCVWKLIFFPLFCLKDFVKSVLFTFDAPWMKAAFDALVVKWEIGFCCTCLEHRGNQYHMLFCCYVTAIIEYATFVNLFSAQLVFCCDVCFASFGSVCILEMHIWFALASWQIDM